MAPEYGFPEDGGRVTSAHTVLRGAGPSETPRRDDRASTRTSAESNGSSQDRSCSVASSRARRAPRGVADNWTLKLRITSLSVAVHTCREQCRSCSRAATAAAARVTPASRSRYPPAPSTSATPSTPTVPGSRWCRKRGRSSCRTRAAEADEGAVGVGMGPTSCSRRLFCSSRRTPVPGKFACAYGC